jgi:hypothetical protein
MVPCQSGKVMTRCSAAGARKFFPKVFPYGRETGGAAAPSAQRGGGPSYPTILARLRALSEVPFASPSNGEARH